MPVIGHSECPLCDRNAQFIVIPSAAMYWYNQRDDMRLCWAALMAVLAADKIDDNVYYG